MHAPFVDALVTTEQAVVVEVDDSTENPLVVDDGTPLHHGGFVTARLSATLDALRQAAYPVIALSAARLVRAGQPVADRAAGVPRLRAGRTARG